MRAFNKGSLGEADKYSNTIKNWFSASNVWPTVQPHGVRSAYNLGSFCETDCGMLWLMIYVINQSISNKNECIYFVLVLRNIPSL